MQIKEGKKAISYIIDILEMQLLFKFLKDHYRKEIKIDITYELIYVN